GQGGRVQGGWLPRSPGGRGSPGRQGRGDLERVPTRPHQVLVQPCLTRSMPAPSPCPRSRSTMLSMSSASQGGHIILPHHRPLPCPLDPNIEKRPDDLTLRPHPQGSPPLLNILHVEESGEWGAFCRLCQACGDLFDALAHLGADGGELVQGDGPAGVSRSGTVQTCPQEVLLGPESVQIPLPRTEQG